MFEVGLLEIENDRAWEYYNFHNHYGGDRANYGANGKGVLMRYTGLKDKNGKEIYEGDVLQGHEGNGVFARRGPVYFDQARFMVKLKDVPRHLKTLAPNYEVIGNIYENPELLASPLEEKVAPTTR